MVPSFLREWREPRHPEFREGRTAWRLFNAFTEGLKGNLDALPHRTQALHGLLDAACGLAVGIFLTVGTQLSFPVVTGGKPILSVPPMINVLYEGTLLGAIIATFLGVLFESRLPDLEATPYDARITEGYLGVLVRPGGERRDEAERALRDAGAVDVVTSPPAPPVPPTQPIAESEG